MATSESPALLDNPDESTSPGDRKGPEVVSVNEGLKKVLEEAHALSAVDGAAVREAVISIAKSVEELVALMRKDLEEPTDDPELVRQWSPETGRFPMSSWVGTDFKATHHAFNIFYTELPEPINIKSLAQDESSQGTCGHTVAYSKDQWSAAPQRILTRSTEILQELRRTTKIHTTTTDLAMIPPFKLLIQYRHEIQKALEDLKHQTEAICEQSPSPVPEEAEGVLSDNNNPPSQVTVDTTTLPVSRIDRLQCIHNLIHTDLANYVGLDVKVRDGSLGEVLFSELYQLFKPGDLILSAEHGENQLHQVYSVTGGRVRRSLTRTNPNMPPGMQVGAAIGTWTDLKINSFIIAWDGENLGPLQVPFSIPHFAGERRVTDLDVYPLQFFEGATELRRRLRARGQKVVECFGHKEYTGAPVRTPGVLQKFGMVGRLESQPSEKLQKSFASSAGDVRADSHSSMPVMQSGFGSVRSDVFIDYAPSYSFFFGTFPSLAHLGRFPSEPAEMREELDDGRSEPYFDSDVDTHLSDKFLSEHRHLVKVSKPRGNLDEDGDRLQLLSGNLPGFIFSTREWAWLNIDSIENTNKGKDTLKSGWKELVIPERFRELLLSVVNNHVSGTQTRPWETSDRRHPNDQMDLIRGKGRGLVVLLHGPPGAGKTSTAETIATYTKRPLYAITCGDLGTDPMELEKNLIKHARLAERWGCVLLLDEADVFLMSRNYDNMKRNAMVSIFLRELEYYSGILFLTTNIVGVIDEAFKSRIHIALEYPALDEKATLEIWGNLLQRIRRDGEDPKTKIKIKFDESSLLRYAKLHYRERQQDGTSWNGRQIRNAFQTAISIGQYRRLKQIGEAEARGEEPKKSTRYITLSVASFKAVAETTSDFEKYITKTRGSDRDRAATHHFRGKFEQNDDPPPRKNYANRTGRPTRNNERGHEENSEDARPRRNKGKGPSKRTETMGRKNDQDSRDRSEPSRSHSGDDTSNEEIIEDSESDEN